jgi:hypothetical protein
MELPAVPLKKFAYLLAALQISRFDITSNGVCRWDLKVGVTRHKEGDEFGIRDNICWVVAFSHPLHNMSTGVHELMKTFIKIIDILELK